MNEWTEEELTRIILLYGDMVLRLAVARTRNRADADDIYQEVFIRLIRYWKQIKNERHLKAWLLRVTNHLCISLHRSSWFKKVRFFHSDDSAWETPGLASFESAYDCIEPERQEDAGDFAIEADECFESEDSDSLLASLSRLSENERAVIHLFYYEELSIREIALILSITEVSAKTRLSRARARLRTYLEDENQ